jgi:thymidylate synthase
VREQLSRDRTLPDAAVRAAPDSIFDYTFDDIVVEDYQHHPAIRAAVAV